MHCLLLPLQTSTRSEKLTATRTLKQPRSEQRGYSYWDTGAERNTLAARLSC
jgi:hypothetical protein